MNILRNCDENLLIKSSILWCPKTGRAVSMNGTSYTGILEITDEYLKKSDTLVTKDGNVSLASGETNKPFYIKKDDIWYIPNAGNLVPIIAQKNKKSLPLITTPLDTISLAKWIDGQLIVFGKK